MSAAPSLYLDDRALSKARYQASSGFSLIEVLLCLTMMALIMVPFTLAMGTGAQSARGMYLQSTRSILLNSLKSETTPSDPNYATNFTDGSMVTTVSDSGQTIPFRRVVDTTTSGATYAMKRTTLFYLYANTTDSSSSALYKTTLIAYPKVYRMRFGNSSHFIDSLNRYWYSDNGGNLVYSGTNKVPGWTATHWTSNYWGNTILNVPSSDATLFQQESGGSSLTYKMDAEPGNYTVKVYFCETNSGDTGTKRAMNITIQGVQMNTDGPYSPYQSTGGNNYGEAKMYDTVVLSSGTYANILQVTISGDSSATDGNANPHGIEIIKRSMM